MDDERNVIPIKQYFEEMDLSDAEKKKRIAFADDVEDMFILILLMLNAEIRAKNTIDVNYYYKTVKRRFRDIVVDVIGPLSDDIMAYIDKSSKQIVDSTIRNQNKPYFFSQDRATFIAENEVNRICNQDDFEKASETTFVKKKWVSMKDKRVRHSHVEVDGKVIPLEAPFLVGTSYMMYPMDTSMGASDSEVIGCRCTVKYIK